MKSTDFTMRLFCQRTRMKGNTMLTCFNPNMWEVCTGQTAKLKSFSIYIIINVNIPQQY